MEIPENRIILQQLLIEYLPLCTIYRDNEIQKDGLDHYKTNVKNACFNMEKYAKKHKETTEYYWSDFLFRICQTKHPRPQWRNPEYKIRTFLAYFEYMEYFGDNSLKGLQLPPVIKGNKTLKTGGY